MNICMVAACLAGGGAERALLDTAEMLTARGHAITVLTFESESSDAFSVPAGVSRVALGIEGHSGNRVNGIRNNLRRIAHLRTAVQRLQPDIVISYLTRTNIICFLALLGTGCPVVATEHNVATLNDAPMHGFWHTLRRIVYPRMAQVVLVSKGAARQYAWLPTEKLSVIHNFLPPKRGNEPEDFGFLSGTSRYLIGMGRLAPEKGFDRLIEAFYLVANDFPDWKLLIVGEGPLRADLTRLVASLGLEDRVLLPGRVANPRTLFRHCDLFALTSDSEGFALVLLEAMSAGLPVVSFDCDFGPREIVTPDISGMLVPPGDVAAFARAIRGLVQDEDLRARLARGGLEAIDRFAPGEILNRWERMLQSVIASSDRTPVRLSARADC